MNDHSPGSGRSDGPIGLDNPLARKLHRMVALSDDDRQRLPAPLVKSRRRSTVFVPLTLGSVSRCTAACRRPAHSGEASPRKFEAELERMP